MPYAGGATPQYQQIGVALWDSPDNSIGGAAAGEGNVISGNAWHGIYGFGANGSGNVIRGNVIGLNADGTGAVPNGYESAARAAILLSGMPGNRIGGVAAGEPNVVASNGSIGVRLVGAGATGNAVLGNAIHDNAGLGLELGSDGVTPNDLGDPDVGANDLLNFPQIRWAGAGAGALDVDFDLDVPAGSYRVEFFSNPGGADPSGYGEGEVYAGATTVMHPEAGLLSFSHSFPGALGDVVTATTTRCTDGPGCTAFGGTSEFSGSIVAVADLVLVKGAYLADGTPIANGSIIPRNLQFFYVLYLNNRGPARSDVSLQDVLDPAFAYQAGTIRYDNSVVACVAVVCTLAEESAIVAAAIGGTPGSDAVDADPVAYAAGSRTVDAGDSSSANQQLDIAGNRVIGDGDRRAVRR